MSRRARKAQNAESTRGDLLNALRKAGVDVDAVLKDKTAPRPDSATILQPRDQKAEELLRK